MVDQNGLDRILIPSNAVMRSVIEFAAAGGAFKLPFEPPFRTGVIVFVEPGYRLAFASREKDAVEFTMYTKDGKPVLTFLYDAYRGPHAHEIPEGIPGNVRKEMFSGMRKGRDDVKQVLFYMAVMFYASRHEEFRETGQKTRNAGTAGTKGGKGGKRAALPLGRRTYIIREQDVPKGGPGREDAGDTAQPAGTPQEDGAETEATDGEAKKRKYEKPDHEVGVRGHWRTLEGGRKVWIRPHTRYKGKKQGPPREYRA